MTMANSSGGSELNDLACDEAFADRLRRRLQRLYPGRVEYSLSQLLDRLAAHLATAQPPRTSGWDQRDVVLITYGDQLRDGNRPTLPVLDEFLGRHELDRLVNTVHILPFCPYSSDDGFSVIDYRAVDQPLGDWSDVAALGDRVTLMFDLVLNHASRESLWFCDYLAGKEPYVDFFVEVDPSADVSTVTRPRSLPLLTPVQTSSGPRHVWTTFSDDQVDLDFSNPDVLVEMLDILLFYVRQGARIVRLDAIAYLWKRLGTSCIHLSETHQVVKLIRDVLDVVAPHVLLLTETNVPHAENVSYLGDGDEAHMVYQFSLPPLLLEALLSGDASCLQNWLADLDDAPAGTTYFNFTASHDGIGVRPLEGLVPDERLEQLVAVACERGGQVSTRRRVGGSDAPYELNISYVSALSGSNTGDSNSGDSDTVNNDTGNRAAGDRGADLRRFLASQAVMLALRGIPGVYFHSLVGTPNDVTAVESSGQPRRINRHKYEVDTLETILSGDSVQADVFRGYRHLLETRIAQPAFHPDGSQQVIDVGHTAVLCFRRTSPAGDQQILVLANVAGEEIRCELPQCDPPVARDLLGTEPQIDGRAICLQPYQVAWLVYHTS